MDRLAERPRQAPRSTTIQKTTPVQATPSTSIAQKLLAPLVVGGLAAWLFMGEPAPEETTRTPEPHSFNMKPLFVAPEWMTDVWIEESILGPCWRTIHWNTNAGKSAFTSKMEIYYYQSLLYAPEAIGIQSLPDPFRSVQEFANFMEQDKGWSKEDAYDIAKLCFAARDPNLKIKVTHDADRS